MIRSLALFLLTSLLVHGFSPVLSRIEPRGGKVGTEVAIRLYGDNMMEPQELLLYQKGLTVKSLTKGKDGKSVKAVLVIAADAPLGEHPIRLRCKAGLTYMRTFWVGQFPTVMEARSEDKKTDLNNSFNEPQKIDLNVTVQGVADREDDDYYLVQCKKGQRLSVEVEAMRLGRVMFDPYLAILDKNRFELAVNDDSPLLKRDCAASIIIPEDGPYTIVVRESSYEGNPASQYRMHIGSFPRPRAIYPPAAKPGEEVEFSFIGDAKGTLKKKIKVGKTPFPAFIEEGGLSSPSGNMVHVSPLDYLNEIEPNENYKQACPVESPPKAPFAFHGVLSSPEDKDWFRFQAKKGENLRFQVLARELRSPLDSVLTIRQAADNKYLQANDDQTQGIPDSRLDYEIPADGVYVLEIRDQLKRGGPDFVYRIELQNRAPSLIVTLPQADRVDTQKDKMIHIPRGNRLAIAPNITRVNIGCDVTFHAPNLPSGLSFMAPSVSRSISDFPILFEATADAPIAGGLYRFEIEDPKTKLRGPFTEKISHLYVNNQGDYHVTETDKIAIAVIAEAPFHLELFAPPVPLVRNGTMTLKVTAKRAEGFTKKIKIKLPWKPPGIGAPNEVEIPEGQNEVALILNANGDAPITDWQILVTGEALTDQGLVRVSSRFADLKVSEPFVQLSLAMAATNPGKNTTVLATVEQLEPFSGEARVILQALPHGVKASELNITSKSGDISFPLEVADDASKGKHANLFCQVIITQNGHPIPHNVGHGGTLRIDPPPPAPKEKPETKAAPVKAPPKEAPKKPLSRLEQLRQLNAQ
ncbi:MAG: hypothetical protein ACJAVK_000909 [Akkermansiaceae bacterium]|jgi:hypothetical protein